MHFFIVLILLFFREYAAFSALPASVISEFEESLVSNAEWLKAQLDQSPPMVDVMPYPRSDFKSVVIPSVAETMSREVSFILLTFLFCSVL